MTQFLLTDENPEGHKLEDLLAAIRKDIILRATKIVDDQRPEAKQVLENNVRILQHITDSIKIAEDSTRLLDRTFGPHQAGQPRIGAA